MPALVAVEPSYNGGMDVEASLAAIEDEGRALNALVEARPEARQETREGPLAGVPVAIKDMFVDRDRPPTCGSGVGAPWLRGTATFIERLRAAGAAIVGYTNLHEWGLGTTSTVSATGPILNPRDRSRIAGGSSGGSAAAVAAGLVDGAVGTDAGGSIRVPAACCGVVGFKPTWGRVPLDGFADGTDGPPVDHAGPMARSVAVVQSMFEVMADTKVEPVDVSGLRVGVLRRQFLETSAADVRQAIEGCIEALGAKVSLIEDVELEGAELAGQVLPMLLLAHTARVVHDDLERRPETFQPETLNLLMLGSQITEENLAQCEAARLSLRAAWERLFSDVDVVLAPTIPALPARADDLTVELPSGPTSAELAQVSHNAPMNLGGVPALSLPCGTSGGWMVNVTVSAARGQDDKALALGHLIEDVCAGRR